MSYSNDLTQIRSGFTNYIGSAIKSLEGNNPNVIKQEVCSILCEEMLKICQNENKIINMYSIKPLLRATIHIFTQRILELDKLLQSNNALNAHEILSKIEQYKLINREIEDVIKNIK